MQIRGLRYKAQIAWNIRNYLRQPMTHERAMNHIKARMDNREKHFLDAVKKLIYENHHSPYRKLLLWAQCDYEDLERSVRAGGIEKTLAKLRDEGVYITLEELRGLVPVCRKDLKFEVSMMEFNNPCLTGGGFQRMSSGSRSKGTRVVYDWDYLTEEAASELLLYENHNVSKAPLALWLLGLPAVSGIHNLLLNLKFQRPPEKWFSPMEEDMLGAHYKDTLPSEYVLWCCRQFTQLRIAETEFTDIGSARKVAEWMKRAKKEKGSSVVRTFASFAVRIVESALKNGIDISGSIIFAGGEALTERRMRFIESSGVRVIPRYASAETGVIGASCRNRNCSDDMHVYMDRLAVIQRERSTKIGGQKVNSFLFTSLSLNAGKVLFNTDMGDYGRLTSRPCGCLIGRLGMNIRVSHVRSYEKLTGEGMTLIGSELDDVVGELIEKAGGCPDDYQFWETKDSLSLNKLIIAVSPDVKGLEGSKFINQILDKLNGKSLITSHIWRQANTVQVVRAYPEFSKGCKMLPVVIKTRRDSPVHDC